MSKAKWRMTNGNQQPLDMLCTKQKLELEVEWFERKLTELSITTPKSRKSHLITNDCGVKKWPKLNQSG